MRRLRTRALRGNAANAQGSAFNGSGTAGGVYANSGTTAGDNPNAVSQYDVACFQQS
jgi:hypothetical protein